MSLLRARCAVLDPHGVRWEVFVSRTRLPEWRPGQVDLDLLPAGSRTIRQEGALALLAVPIYVVTDLVWPLLRALVLLPFGAAGDRRSPRRLVEVVTWWPVHEAYRWTTDASTVDAVVSEIVAGLEQGRVVHPAVARFEGSGGP